MQIRRQPTPLALLFALIAAIFFASPAASARTDIALALDGVWPAADATGDIREETVSLSSMDSFSLVDASHDGRAPERDVDVRVFMPANASESAPVPAVVLVHGSGGVINAREITYARQLASMGVAALVIDAFGNRRDLGSGFIDRLLNVTEAMLLADAFAGLRYFDERPDVDGERVVIVGFSYGAMVSTVAAFAQVAETYAPEGPHFAGHVAYYGPCIVRFSDPRPTGAPLLMLYGTGDALVVPEDCQAILDDLAAGGVQTRLVGFDGAPHQWDGAVYGRRSIGRNLADCSFNVERSGTVRDNRTWLPMTNVFTRRLILGLCTDEDGYLIGRDDDVRKKSNVELARFLAGVFEDPATVSGSGGHASEATGG